MSLAFDTFGIARLLRPSQRVSVVNNTKAGTSDGTIIGIDGLILTLSQSVVFEAGRNYSILIEREDGSVEGIPVAEGSDPTKVVLSRVPASNPYVEYDAERTRFIFAENTDEGALSLLIESVEGRVENGQERISLTCINYDER